MDTSTVLSCALAYPVHALWSITSTVANEAVSDFPPSMMFFLRVVLKHKQTPNSIFLALHQLLVVVKNNSAGSGTAHNHSCQHQLDSPHYPTFLLCFTRRGSLPLPRRSCFMLPHFPQASQPTSALSSRELPLDFSYKTQAT